MWVKGGNKLKKFIYLILLILLLLIAFPNHLAILSGIEKSEALTIFYDFVQNADKAIWKNAKTSFSFFGTRPGDISNNPVDSRGFACWRTNVTLEDSKVYSKVLETHPEWVDNGEISGTYPVLTVPSNAKLIIKFGFMKGATKSDGVVAKIFFDDKKIPVPVWSSDLKDYNGILKIATVNLSSLAGKFGSFVLYIHTYKSSTQDWACWVDAKIEYEELKPDLIVSDIRISENRVYYKIKNIGNASLFHSTPLPFTNILYLNGVKVAQDILSINLLPNQEYESYFKTYNFVEPINDYKMKVCGDTNNNIDESNEKNNCLEKVFKPSFGGIKVDTGCPNVKVDIYDNKNILVKSGFSDNTNMYSTGLTLIPGTYKVVPSKEGFTFEPNEKSVNVIANQLSGVSFICKKILKPDLTIENIECNFEKKVINFTIVNIGDEKVNKPFDVVLIIDNVQRDSVLIKKPLNPDEKFTTSFTKYFLPCLKLKIKVIVDDSKNIDESNENNNSFEKECICEEKDEVPPKIIDGPNVINITEDSAEIVWKTDEDSDSIVFYDSKTGILSKSKEDKNYVTNHKVKITNLKQGTIYEFYVSSKDKNKNITKSGEKYFKTLNEEDKEKPTINLIVPKNILGITTILANVRDNKKVDRVVFYIDNNPFFIDYSSPYEFDLNSVNLIDGTHSFSANAFDAFGNMSVAVIEGNIMNNLFSPIINIIEPQEGQTVEGDTTIKVRVECPNIGCQERAGLIKLEYYINNSLISSEIYSSTSCIGPPSRRHCYTSPPASLPLENEISYIFTLANRENEIDINIKVIAYYSTGTTGTASINVNKRFIPREIVEITREVIHSSENYYTVNLKIKNTGNVDYNKGYIQLKDAHCGFEVGTDIKFFIYNPYKEEDSGWEVSIENLYDPSEQHQNSGDPTLVMNFEKTDFILRPDEYVNIIYKLVPILYDKPLNYQHIIGCRPLEYKWGLNEEEYLIYPITYDLCFNKNNEFTSLTNVTDYLIVTNPTNLYTDNMNKLIWYNKLLSTMAELAIEKNGTLGFFISTTMTEHAVDCRHIIRNWGIYGNYLCPDWNENGYLLIVGETEIVPTFTVSHWDGNYDSRDDTIHWTDSPYASTGGEDIHPEICIGRIIGNYADDLIIPLETSLKVKKGEKEFCRNNYPCASAMVISGVGNYQSRFTCTAADLVDDDQGDLGSEFEVYFLQGSSYHDDEDETAYDKRREIFLNNVTDRDVIVYVGHGWCNPAEGWYNIINTNELNQINFGRASPFIFAASCCTGRYEASGDNFAETMLIKGAGIYIGATEISIGGPNCTTEATNDEETNKLFDAWLNHPDKTIAEAWKERRQSIAYEKWFENSRYWSTEYQFYGDPKFDKK